MVLILIIIIDILDAMRVLFYELPLSGEAQVIDKVVQTFGEKILSADDNIDINKKGTITPKCISKINEGNLFILNLISTILSLITNGEYDKLYSDDTSINKLIYIINII